MGVPYMVRRYERIRVDRPRQRSKSHGLREERRAKTETSIREDQIEDKLEVLTDSKKDMEKNDGTHVEVFITHLDVSPMR